MLCVNMCVYYLHLVPFSLHCICNHHNSSGGVKINASCYMIKLDCWPWPRGPVDKWFPSACSSSPKRHTFRIDVDDVRANEVVCLRRRRQRRHSGAPLNAPSSRRVASVDAVSVADDASPARRGLAMSPSPKRPTRAADFLRRARRSTIVSRCWRQAQCHARNWSKTGAAATRELIAIKNWKCWSELLSVDIFREEKSGSDDEAWVVD